MPATAKQLRAHYAMHLALSAAMKTRPHRVGVLTFSAPGLDVDPKCPICGKKMKAVESAEAEIQKTWVYQCSGHAKLEVI